MLAKLFALTTSRTELRREMFVDKPDGDIKDSVFTLIQAGCVVYSFIAGK